MTEDINLRFEHLKEKMIDPKFQKNKGLSNEVGYWIFDYPANQELEVRKKIAKIKESALASRVNLKVFDIYNVMMTLLKDQKNIQVLILSQSLKKLKKIKVLTY